MCGREPAAKGLHLQVKCNIREREREICKSCRLNLLHVFISNNFTLIETEIAKLQIGYAI